MTRDEVIARLGETIFAAAMMEMNRYDIGLCALETLEEIVAEERACPPMAVQPMIDKARPTNLRPLDWWQIPPDAAT